jgi:hypothetical protein
LCGGKHLRVGLNRAFAYYTLLGVVDLINEHHHGIIATKVK